MGNRIVVLGNGVSVAVPDANPAWFDDVIADSQSPDEAAMRIFAQIDPDEPIGGPLFLYNVDRPVVSAI
jgi:hypothetical protein